MFGGSNRVTKLAEKIFVSPAKTCYMYERVSPRRFVILIDSVDESDGCFLRESRHASRERT